MPSNYKCHAQIRQTRTHTQKVRENDSILSKREIQRERHRHGFTQAPEEARLERPQVWPWQGLAQPKWGQQNLHGQLSLSLSLSLFLILCSFFVLYGFDLGCYSMLWCDWFDFIVFTLFRLVWLLRNRQKILEMEWIGYRVYGFLSWVDLIFFFFFSF